MPLGTLLRRMNHPSKYISYHPICGVGQWLLPSQYSTCIQKRMPGHKVRRNHVLCVPPFGIVTKMFRSDFKSEDERKRTLISDEYIPFQDRKQIIQDVIDQQWNPLPEWRDETLVQTPINLERGKTGVFDLDELTELLKSEHAEDVCVIAVPKEINYVDHIVIVTARSSKHMFALATFIRKRFKTKNRKKTDVIPKLEGTKKSSDWIALDLGNIVLHVFCHETRREFDLETLWSVGPQFDDLVNEKDSDIVQLLNLLLIKNS